MKAQKVKEITVKTAKTAAQNVAIAYEIVKLQFTSIKLPSTEPKEFGVLAGIADQVAIDMKKVRTKQDMQRLAFMMRQNSKKIQQLAQQM